MPKFINRVPKGKIKSTNVKNRADKEADVLDIVVRHKSEVRSCRTALETSWGRWYEQYLNLKTDNVRETSSNIDTGMILQHTETLTAFYDQMLFGLPDYFNFKPKTDNDVRAARLNKQILKHQLTAMEYRRKVGGGIRKTVLLGTQIYKQGWNISEPKTIVELSNKGQPTIKKNSTVDMLDISTPRLFDVFFDPKIDIDDFQFLDHISQIALISIDTLRRGEKAGMYSSITEALAKVDAQSDADNGDETAPMVVPGNQALSPERKGQDYMAFGNRPTSHIRKLMVTEAWLDYDLDDDGFSEPCRAVILEDSAVIHLEQNPYWFNAHPYLITRFLPIEGSAYGRGVADINESLALAGRDLLNRLMDNIDWIINNQWIASANARIRTDDMKGAPNKVYISRSTVNDLVPLITPNIINENVLAINLINEIGKQNVGATDTLQGRALGQRTSASEAQTVFNAAARRMTGQSTNFELNLTLPFLGRGIKLNQQFMDEKMFLRITGEEGAKLKDQFPSATVGDYDIEVVGATLMENRTALKSEMIGWYNILRTSNPQERATNMKKLEERIYNMIDPMGFKEIALPGAIDPETIEPDKENVLLAQNQYIAPKIFENHDEHNAMHRAVPKVVETEAGRAHIGMHEILKEQAASMTSGIGQGSTSPQSIGGLGQSLQPPNQSQLGTTIQ